MIEAIKKTQNYLKTILEREVRSRKVMPRNLLLYLTYRCTSRCKACTMWSRKTDKRELTLSEWKKFIDSLSDYDIGNVEMFGGDALLRKDVLIELVKYVKAKGVPEVDLVTNCNLMDYETAQALVDSRIDIVYVSLDGIGKVHDHVRGLPGSFKRTESGLKYLIAAKAKTKSDMPHIVVNTTISKLNINDFEKIIPFADELGANDVALEYVGEFPKSTLQSSAISGIIPEPYYIPQGKSLLLDTDEAKLLKQKVRRLKDQRHKYNIRLVTKNIDMLKVENIESGVFASKHCYVCRYYMIVDPFGNALPCPFFNNYHLGNILKSHPDQIWDTERHHQFIAHVDGAKSELCKHCILNVERNFSFIDGFRRGYYTLTGKGFDE